jgi:hypothetical protein
VSPITSDVIASESPPDAPPCCNLIVSLTTLQGRLQHCELCLLLHVCNGQPLVSLSRCSFRTNFSLSSPHCSPSITPTALQCLVGSDSLSLHLQPKATTGIHRFRQSYRLRVKSKIHNRRACILHLTDCAATTGQKISSRSLANGHAVRHCSHGLYQERQTSRGRDWVLRGFPLPSSAIGATRKILHLEQPQNH